VQSLDFERVVRSKAVEAARLLGIAVLVEDSGLSVSAWNGYPGPLTKWVTTAVGEAGLARMLDCAEDRAAEAVSALAVARPGASERDVIVATGRARGTIAPLPRGSGGFGWDVLFIPEGEARTFAEMTLEDKDRISHRGLAFRALRRLLGAGGSESARPEA
jgi:XTP/dITP diphosphohydrolase